MLAIADAFDDSSAGPDDLVLRQALIRQLDSRLSEHPPEPIEALRDISIDYAFGLALIEIEASTARVTTVPKSSHSRQTSAPSSRCRQIGPWTWTARPL